MLQAKSGRIYGRQSQLLLFDRIRHENKRYNVADDYVMILLELLMPEDKGTNIDV